jgi:hypothetical protein
MDMKPARYTAVRNADRSVLRMALDQAAIFDGTLRATNDQFETMLERYIAPAPYERDALFRRLISGEPTVMNGVPAPTRGLLTGLSVPDAAAALLAWLLKRRSPARYRLYGGKGAKRRYLTLRDAAAAWSRDTSVFGVADLHIRDTSMEDIIDPDALAPFNLLTASTPDVQRQEMYSLVISTRGYVTDSHSDAPDSTNYCFTGRKLWIAWETQEGLEHGLEDVEHVKAKGRARFDLRTWMNLPSARWFLVGPGETLYFPAHLSHKVVTIERYLGVGGFFFCLPGAFRLLSHWILKDPLWLQDDAAGENEQLVAEIARTALGKIRRSGAKSGGGKAWGLDYLRLAADDFVKTCPQAELEKLQADSHFAPLLAAAAQRA